MKKQVQVLGGVLFGIGLRWISFDYNLNERLEFSSGLTSYSQILEELEYPTPIPLHPRNDLLNFLIELGVVSHLFFILVDVLLAATIYFSLQLDLSTTRKLQFEQESELIGLWEKEGRPRLYSEGDQVLVNHDTGDNNNSEPVVYAASTRISIDEDSFLNLPTTLALVYFLCPISIATCGAQSFAPLFSLLNLSSVFWAQKKQPVLAACFLALAVGAQGLILAFVLLVPLFLLLEQNRQVFVFAFVCAMGIMVYVFPSTGRLPFSTPFLDLRPNVGLWWYLETEVFAQYHAYFTLLLEAFLYLSQTCLHIFLSSRGGLVLAHFSLAVYVTFQPFPELFHVFLAVFLLSCHVEFLLHEEWLWPCLIVLTTVILVLQPLMLYLWLERGSGNANYYYFQNLASNGMVAILLVRFYAKVNTRDAVMRRISKFLKFNKKE